MTSRNSLVPGQIVKSKAGHDKGEIFFVIAIVDDDYVLIADGDRRRSESPKKKKVRHLQPYNIISQVIADKAASKTPIENIELRKELEKSGAVTLAISDQEETVTYV